MTLSVQLQPVCLLLSEWCFITSPSGPLLFPTSRAPSLPGQQVTRQGHTDTAEAGTSRRGRLIWTNVNKSAHVICVLVLLAKRKRGPALSMGGGGRAAPQQQQAVSKRTSPDGRPEEAQTANLLPLPAGSALIPFFFFFVPSPSRVPASIRVQMALCSRPGTNTYLPTYTRAFPSDA